MKNIFIVKSSESYIELYCAMATLEQWFYLVILTVFVTFCVATTNDSNDVIFPVADNEQISPFINITFTGKLYLHFLKIFNISVYLLLNS